MDRSLKCFTNCLLCISGELVAQDIYFSTEQGIITPNYYYRQEGVERIDLNGKIVAPGYLDLQTNGMNGVHFTHLAQNGDAEDDERKLRQISEMEARHGVTGWWA
jgi:N-acetylglucosamine-6-phosphate deacetylase